MFHRHAETARVSPARGPSHEDPGQLIYGGIEAGGTKWVCAIGRAPDEVAELVTIATTTPAETIAHAAAFFAAHGPLTAIGVGSFGPLDLRPGSPTWGRITTTPKAGWSDTDIAGMLAGGDLAAPELDGGIIVAPALSAPARHGEDGRAARAGQGPLPPPPLPPGAGPESVIVVAV
ncbi:MAG: ROK family protein [Gaiellales bacterium]